MNNLPRWLKAGNGCITFPVMDPYTKRWFGWIDDELVDITDEYLEYVRNKDEDGKLKYES